MDIKTIKTVINFDVAKDIDSHIHRIGRTCRAGSLDGVAYTLISPKNKQFAPLLVKNLKGANQFIPPQLAEMAKQEQSKRFNTKNQGNASIAPPSGMSSSQQNSSQGRGIGFGGSKTCFPASVPPASSNYATVSSISNNFVAASSGSDSGSWVAKKK